MLGKLTLALYLLMVGLELSRAQVQATMSMVDEGACQQLLSRGFCKYSSLWVGTLENQGAEPVAVGQSAVLSKIPQLRPIDLRATQILAQQAQSRSPFTVVVELLGGGSTLGASILTGKVQSSSSIAKFLASAKASYYLSSFLLVEPYIARFVAGRQIPTQENFTSLVWDSPIQLQPGGKASFHVFTARWQVPPAPLQFVLDVGRAQQVRMMQ